MFAEPKIEQAGEILRLLLEANDPTRFVSMIIGYSRKRRDRVLWKDLEDLGPMKSPETKEDYFSKPEFAWRIRIRRFMSVPYEVAHVKGGLCWQTAKPPRNWAGPPRCTASLHAVSPSGRAKVRLTFGYIVTFRRERGDRAGVQAGLICAAVTGLWRGCGQVHLERKCQSAAKRDKKASPIMHQKIDRRSMDPARARGPGEERQKRRAAKGEQSSRL